MSLTVGGSWSTLRKGQLNYLDFNTRPSCCEAKDSHMLIRKLFSADNLALTSEPYQYVLFKYSIKM